MIIKHITKATIALDIWVPVYFNAGKILEIILMFLYPLMILGLISP
jgi:hypothetical protein